MLQAIRSISKHILTRQQLPKALSRYFSWQISSMLGNPEQIKPWVNGLNIIVKQGYHASTACHYFGIPEFESMGFLLHFLRPSDLFVDVGANIGSYSLLAAGVCGTESLAFEPDGGAAEMLLKNRNLNGLESLIKVHEIGLGESHDSLQLTSDKGIQNHISVGNDPNAAHIRIAPLDDFCETRPPDLIKIDVEGFETAVIKGAEKTLAKPGVKALIVEKMGLGQRYGFDEDALHHLLLSFGFQLFDYQPFTRRLEHLSKPIFGNNLYLRDPNFVENRVKNGPKISVHGHSF